MKSSLCEFSALNGSVQIRTGQYYLVVCMLSGFFGLIWVQPLVVLMADQWPNHLLCMMIIFIHTVAILLWTMPFGISIKQCLSAHHAAPSKYSPLIRQPVLGERFSASFVCGRLMSGHVHVCGQGVLCLHYMVPWKKIMEKLR